MTDECEAARSEVEPPRRGKRSLPEGDESLRTFIAIELPDEFHRKLGALQEKLKEAGGDVAWVKPENIHITLKFLGNVKKEKIADIEKALDWTAKDEVPFTLNAKGIGAFPKPSYPRILWAGIEESKNLKSVAEKIEGAMENLGFPKEERQFAAHLTLGRVKSTKNKEKIANLIENTSFEPGITVRVEKLVLFQSTLTPKGSIYTALHEARFSL